MNERGPTDTVEKDHSMKTHFPVHTLHTRFGLKRAFMRSGFDRLKGGDLSWLDEETDEKLKRNVVTGALIEDLWAFQKNDINRRPESAGLDLGIHGTVNILRNKVKNRAPDGVDSMIDKFLQTETQAVLQAAFHGWMDLRTCTCFQEEPKTINALYKWLFEAVQAEGYTLKNFLIRGINTANTETWNAIKVIPAVYHRQFGADVSVADFSDIARRNGVFLSDFSNTHVDIMSTLSNASAYSMQEAGKRFMLSEMFQLVSHQDQLFLAFAPKVYKDLRQPEEMTSTTGCPARMSVGEKDAVITEMNNWIVDVAALSGVLEHASEMRIHG